MIESMVEHMVRTLKYGGPEASIAIKKTWNPIYEETDELDEGTTRKEQLKFDRKFDTFMKKEETWKENSGKIFEKISPHCAPTVNTKLCGMED